MGGSEHPIVDVPKELLDGSAVHILILEFFPHRLNDPDTWLIGYLILSPRRPRGRDSIVRHNYPTRLRVIPGDQGWIAIEDLKGVGAYLMSAQCVLWLIDEPKSFVYSGKDSRCFP